MEGARGPIIVSACLLGLKTRHDGGSATDPFIVDLASTLHVVPVCPEQLGGLSTPRPRAEISDRGHGGNGPTGADVLTGAARVLDEDGMDVTESFKAGAKATAEIARITGAKEAYLKEKSPSCGVMQICRHGGLAEGAGVTTALLKARGLKVRGF